MGVEERDKKSYLLILERKMVRKILFMMLMLVVVVGLFSGGVFGAVIFEENWDGPAPTNGFPNSPGASWNGWTTATYNEGQGYSELSTNIKHSGTKSLYQLKRANENFVLDQIRNFNPTTEIRIRFYVYFDADYANYHTAGSNDNVHFMFLQSGLSGRGVRMDIVEYVSKTVCGSCPYEPPYTYPWTPGTYPTCVASEAGYFSIASPSGYGSTFYGVTRGQPNLCFNVKDNLERWIEVEWAYKINSVQDGRVSLWIDGVEMMRDELLPPDPSYMTISMMMISGYLSQGRNYDLGFYIDDITMTDDYDIEIGPLNGEPPVCSNGVCEGGENCPADVGSCSDNQCYEPTCNNGCGQTLVGTRQTDESCSGNNFCDGSGNCVECIDNTDCTSPDTCVSNVCTSLSTECSDGADNDGDGQIDYPNDPGCLSSTDNSEYGSAECDDGIDNDGDGDTDYRVSGGDQGCLSLTDSDETNCGDGQCEGGEVCDVCVLDCGECGSTITVEFGDHLGSDHPGTVEDTFLNQDEWGNDVNANSIQLNTYTWPTDVIANTILMKFDLSAIPSSATITSAQLQLYQYEWDTDRDDSYRLTAHKVINHNPIISQANGYTYDGTNSWTAVTPSGSYYENDFGYLCCNGNVPMAMNDISNIVDTVYADRIEGYKTWDITSMVSDWVNNPFSNYGLLIVSEDNTFGEAHRLFYSSEYSDSTRRPKLIVSYSLGTTTCSPADTNSDGVVSMVELMSYIGLWKAGNVNIVELMTGIDEWKNGC